MEIRSIMKITIAGTGYVGLSIATLLAQNNEVTAVDIVPERVEMINNKKSPIQDDYIEDYLKNRELNLRATLDAESGYRDADFVVIAAPTNYDSAKNFFDTSAVEDVISKVMKYNPEAIMVIKSTIPVGYTESIRRKVGSNNIIFSPEFLRESKALYDNLYPSRIIVGYAQDDERLGKAAHQFAQLIKQGATIWVHCIDNREFTSIELDDTYTSDKPNGYYIEKAFFKDKTGINYNRTHFMTNTLFGYYDPDKGTNTRWWETDETSESVYRFATPKSSRIK